MGFIIFLLTVLILAPACQKGPAREVFVGKPSGPYRVELRLDPSRPVAGQKTMLTYAVKDAKIGAPISDLQVLHERILHTFIVSRDLGYFVHTHHEDFFPLSPQDVAKATFHYPHTFPYAGEYIVTAEFTHEDRTWFKRFEIAVGGEGESKTPEKDLRREKLLSGYRISLRSSPDPPVAGHRVELVCHTETTEGKPVTDLGLYLGGEVHLALWRLDGEHFGHQHAYTPEMAAMMRMMREHSGEPNEMARMMVRMMRGPTKQVYFGPDIPLQHTFPEAGTYKLFFEIAPQGKVVVVDFMIEVVEYSEEVDTQVHSIVPTELSS
jgi:hypothetical protein